MAGEDLNETKYGSHSKQVDSDTRVPRIYGNDAVTFDPGSVWSK